MKYVLYGLLLCFLSSIAGIVLLVIDDQPKGWYLRSYYNNGNAYSIIHCDSLQMESQQVAYVFINGHKQKIVGEDLRPAYNQ